jgi:hypothetical protein
MSAMQQAAQASRHIEAQPLVDAIGVTWTQEGVTRDPMRAMAVGNAQQGCRPFPRIGMRMMAHRFLQGLAFGLAEDQSQAMAFFDQLTHRTLLSGTVPHRSILLPILIVNVH